MPDEELIDAAKLPCSAASALCPVLPFQFCRKGRRCPEVILFCQEEVTPPALRYDPLALKLLLGWLASAA
jgi:hypothetical protein